MDLLKEKLKHLPENPGVYIMQNAEGQIIYVGKAKNLKNRVRQYFFNSVKTDKVMAMVSNVADFSYIIAQSEVDALSLENTLIKKHKPRYNILLKDDKTYPYLKINLKERYPTFKITRKILKDGAKYFGPYMGGVSVNSVLEILYLAFNVRPCVRTLGEKADKPCLNYHIKKCHAPCAKLITEDEYRKRVEGAIAFLNGDTDYAEKLLEEKMLLSAENEEFELAIKYKEKLESLKNIALKRITVLNKFIDADIIASDDNGLYSAISLLIVRKGKMVGSKNFAFTSAVSSEDIISEFILRYYKKGVELPEEIILDQEVSNTSVLEEYLKNTLNEKTVIHCPKQGVKKHLANMAYKNASEHLAVAVSKIKHKNDMTVNACERLKDILSLKRYPKRMECFDISNISGVDKVGSMVVFIDGEKQADLYRRFKIKTFEGADDFRAHQEMMERRLNRLITDPEKFAKPDLVIIDGGKGQLSAVKEIFDSHGITDIDLIALAEKEEEIYTLYSSEPIRLEKSDESLKVLIRIRDEAHRFAITFHRELRGKRALSSVLDGVKGVGKKKIALLIERFKDISGIAKATKSELMQVEGIGETHAQAIMDLLTKEGLK
ncbi:MAG: excinuclease ABC subunit UvrC [Clostridia bacterium]|nr:excinuclease ABC subunit UvrC [Clostridia bacterium]